MAHDLNTFEIKLDWQTLRLRASDKLHFQKYTWDTKRHCNAEYELHMILKGACHVYVEDQLIPLEEMQAILIAPGQYHHPKVTAGEFERFSASFDVTNGPLLSMLQSQVCKYKVFSLTPELEQICRSTFCECAAGNPYQKEMMQSLLTQLTVSTIRLLGLPSESQSQQTSIREQSRIDLIDDYFEKNFTERAGKAALAQLLHLSERQLARILLEHYGMSFQQKLTRTRMDHATWLLRTTQKQIGEIAACVGYASEASFYQVFRKQFGITPQQYRLQFQS